MAMEIVGDEIDEDCDGSEMCFYDRDGDHYRDAMPQGGSDRDCGDPGEAPAAWPIDCNDLYAAIHAGATEVVADNIDEDCDGGEICYQDLDGDMYRTSLTTISANPYCNDMGEAPVYWGMDCNDGNAAVHPGVTEIAGNGRDDDCNGRELCYADVDRDGYGSMTATVDTTDIACTMAGDTLSSAATDCCDSDAAAHPGLVLYSSTARTGCGGYDFNCDSTETRRENVVNAFGIACRMIGGSCIVQPAAYGWTGAVVPACGTSAQFNDCSPSCTTVVQSRTQTCR